jgi:hypothetical protein
VDIFHKEKPPITTKKTTPKRPKRSVSLKFNLSRPPNNSRLNLYLVFFGKDSWHYEIAARLIRNLYSGCPDFDSLPGAEYQLLNALTAKKEKMTTLAFPDELASIDLEHENLQHLLYFMLKGGTIKERHFPSFLNFVSFDRKLTNESCKFNLLFISHELLNVILQNESATCEIIEKCNIIWERILYEEENRKNLSKEQCLNRSQIKNYYKLETQRILDSHSLSSLKNHFDYGLGKVGNVLLVCDSQTGLIIREKIPSLSPGSSKRDLES